MLERQPLQAIEASLPSCIRPMIQRLRSYPGAAPPSRRGGRDPRFTSAAHSDRRLQAPGVVPQQSRKVEFGQLYPKREELRATRYDPLYFRKQEGESQ
jgi:hypothetical protein